MNQKCVCSPLFHIRVYKNKKGKKARQESSIFNASFETPMIRFASFPYSTFKNTNELREGSSGSRYLKSFTHSPYLYKRRDLKLIVPHLVHHHVRISGQTPLHYIKVPTVHRWHRLTCSPVQEALSDKLRRVYSGCNTTDTVFLCRFLLLQFEINIRTFEHMYRLHNADSNENRYHFPKKLRK